MPTERRRRWSRPKKRRAICLPESSGNFGLENQEPCIFDRIRCGRADLSLDLIRISIGLQHALYGEDPQF